MSDDPFATRKALTFEQAEGVVAIPGPLQLKEISKPLRAALWRVIYDELRNSRRRADYSQHAHLIDPWFSILRDMHTFRYHEMADEFDNNAEDLIAEVKAIFEHGDYIEILGWIQWVLRAWVHSSVFAREINSVLTGFHAAYRIVDGRTIVPIGSETELHTVEQAFADLSQTEFNGARAHLLKAATELTAGNAADSIRESIHAVESVAKVLEPSGEFSKALAKIQSSTKMHGAMRSGMASLYGYSSDEKGIRHPLLDDGTAQVDEADALFMIGACAAFVSFLINKARTAGMIK